MGPVHAPPLSPAASPASDRSSGGSPTFRHDQRDIEPHRLEGASDSVPSKTAQ